MTTGSENLDRLCINTVRMLAVDAIEKARSGHPGMPMGAAPMAYALWTRHLRHNPGDPLWPNRDRFVLSAGHGSMLLYALLHLTGYDLPLEELQRFRQWGSRTPGHPEHGLTPGVETTTGPLGQGLANAVGMAMAERHLAARFNRPGFPVVDHRTYVLAGDGDLMEGVCHEAASLAGHLQLGKLICLYDDNRISIEGSTDLTFTEDRGARFRSYGWQVLQVEDGNDVEAISAALREAEADHARPSLIMVRTQIGFGSPGKAGKASAHGEPLGADEVRATKLNLGWPLEPAFFIPEQALQHFRTALERGRQWQAAWEALWLDYQRTYPELAAEWNQWWQGQLPQGWDADIPAFAPDAGGLATRVASGTVLNALAGRIPYLVGGAADLEPSTKTGIRGGGDFSAHDPGGRNIHFGVREHAMGAILNGMALHGGLLPFGATFLVFSNYMLPPVRLAALMGLHVIYVFTHDSIGLGEDGPTHQPVEQLASLRAIPGLTVLRPADANETAEAWRVAVQSWGPVALVLTRQNVPVLDRTHYAPASGVARGAYVLKDPAGATPAAILLATGSEVHVALEAAQGLEADGIPTRVVSMPSWELFERQSEEYRRAVLPPGITRRVAIEAGSPLGWHRYVGPHGTVVGMEDFGASAPARELFERFGFTAAAVVEHVKRAGTMRGRRVALGSDHGGFPLKGVVAAFLSQSGCQVLDVGTWSEDAVDYPDIARAVGEAILDGRAERGIILCGSGIGACVAANKLPGIRAGVAQDSYSARQGVEHDDVNVLCLGARVMGPQLAQELVRSFMEAEFSGEERHRRRLAKVEAMEERERGRRS